MRHWIRIVESANEHPWERDVWEVRCEYEDRWAGSCEGAAGELAERLKTKGIKARVMCGAFDHPSVNDEGEENEYSSHCWVEIDGYILDPTVEQFDTDETIVPMNSEGARRYLFGEEMIDTLMEEWSNTYVVDGHNIDVFKNPSKSEFLKLIAKLESEHGVSDWPLRAFVTKTDLHIWDAYIATHSDMSNFQIPTAGGYIYLNKDQILLNDLNWESSEGGEKPYGAWVRRYYDAIMTNPSIKRIYGSNPKIIGADDEGLAGYKGFFDITPDFIEKNVER